MKEALPIGWVHTRLGDIARWSSGGTPSRRNADFYSGSIPWIKTGELGAKYVRSAEEHISQQAIASSSAKVFPVGSVAIAMYGATIGKVSIFAIDAATNQACAVAQCRPGIFNEFLYYFLVSQKRNFVHAGKGGAQPNISQTILKAWPIDVPPSNEQRRIVAKIEELFSELDKGIEALEAARQQLTVYRQAVLKQAFEGKLTEGWRKQNKSHVESCSSLLEAIGRASNDYYAREMREWQAAIKNWEAHGEKGKRPPKPERPADLLPVPEEDITVLPSLPRSWAYVRLATLAQIGSGMSVSKDRLIGDPVEVPYLRVANVQRGRLDLSHMASMKIERTQLRSLALKNWDVLFNEGGDRDKLGRGWIWEDQIDPCITQNHVFRVSPYLASEAHSKFISYWGNTFGQEYFNTQGKQTTNLASINKSVLSAFPIPLPSMQEQAEIVNEIESRLSLADSLQAEIDAALERHAVLGQSILSKAFSGQLVSQNASDEPASALLERIRNESETAMNGKKNSRRKEAA